MRVGGIYCASLQCNTTCIRGDLLRQQQQRRSMLLLGLLLVLLLVLLLLRPRRLPWWHLWLFPK
jgi:hypothetical protein